MKNKKSGNKKCGERDYQKPQKHYFVPCTECEYLSVSSVTAECGKGYLGVITIKDGCSRGKRRRKDNG